VAPCSNPRNSWEISFSVKRMNQLYRAYENDDAKADARVSSSWSLQVRVQASFQH
jgi:hypothetical protein